ncbi:MAG: hypothetical protein OXM57_11960 [bacterium]|nr:hypothetical protein [bacterium]
MEWIVAPAAIVVVALVGGFWKWARWTGRVDTNLTELKGFMREIRADIKKIFERLPAAPIGSASPRTLTDYGKKIAEAVKATSWAEREAQGLDDQAKGMRGYEIEDLAFQHVSNHDLAHEIRETAFEQGFTVDHVRDVLAVVLRDQLLERR